MGKAIKIRKKIPNQLFKRIVKMVSSHRFISVEKLFGSNIHSVWTENEKNLYGTTDVE